MPLTFSAAKWYGYVLSTMYMLYGGVQIILGILDNNYSDLGTWVISLFVGIFLLSVTLAYRDLKKWGWQGMVLLNAIFLIVAAFGYSDRLNIVLLVFAAAAQTALLWPSTRQCIANEA